MTTNQFPSNLFTFIVVEDCVPATGKLVKRWHTGFWLLAITFRHTGIVKLLSRWHVESLIRRFDPKGWEEWRMISVICDCVRSLEIMCR